jgi:hypothetical protein
MTDEQRLAIERNLFEVARDLVRERANFPWHRDDSGQFTASCQKSSQALAIDVFHTVDRLRSRNRSYCRCMGGIVTTPAGARGQVGPDT